MNESLYGTDKERGFKRIYDLYADNVYRLCFSYMKNKMDAEDIMQETFFKFYQRRQFFSRDEEAKAWLLVTASNQCKNALKHWWRKRKDIDDYAQIIGTEEPERLELMELVMNLPERYKTAVYLYYYEGYNSRQISEMLHKPESTVRTHLKNAKAILKREWERE